MVLIESDENGKNWCHGENQLQLTQSNKTSGLRLTGCKQDCELSNPSTRRRQATPAQSRHENRNCELRFYSRSESFHVDKLFIVENFILTFAIKDK